MALPSGLYNTSYAKDSAIVRTRLQWGILIVALIVLFLLPLFGIGEIWLSFINRTSITLIAVLGLAILMGYCGQVSLGQSAFMGVGAYTTAIVAFEFGWPFWATLPVALFATCVWGVIFGLPALRVKGFYLAMTTIACQFVFLFLIRIFPDITGGPFPKEVEPISLGGFVLNSDFRIYYLIMPLTIIALVCAKNLTRSKLGRAFMAIRDNDLAAEAMGINLVWGKLTAFIVCSLFAGLAGWLLAYQMWLVYAEMFHLMESLWFIGMMVVGGLGSITGAVFGVVLFRGIEEVLIMYSAQLSAVAPALGSALNATLTMVYALVIALTMIFEPRGLAHRWEIIRAYYRNWPFSYRA